jgi:leader peptidase (prepilin peptidase)/N-methyltransferase
VWSGLTILVFGAAGVAAGAAGARLLRRARRGARVPVVGCAVTVALTWSVVGARAGELPLWWWPVPLVVGWAGVLLGAADLATRRLPDVLTLPGYPVVAALLVPAGVCAGDAGLLSRSALGAVLWAGGYAAVRLIAPDALGGGDVKLAGLLGAVTAATSWSGLLLAVLAATALTAVISLFARVLRGQRDVPHGPAMLAAAWLIALSPVE